MYCTVLTMLNGRKLVASQASLHLVLLRVKYIVEMSSTQTIGKATF